MPKVNVAGEATKGKLAEVLLQRLQLQANREGETDRKRERTGRAARKTLDVTRSASVKDKICS